MITSNFWVINLSCRLGRLKYENKSYYLLNLFYSPRIVADTIYISLIFTLYVILFSLFIDEETEDQKVREAASDSIT